MTREMLDSAFPLGGPPPGGWRDIILIYAGGDTVHAWSLQEILRMPARYRWPCWVRSNPGQVDAVADANACVRWLQLRNVPKGTSVILDLETAVNGPYVSLFDLTVGRAGWKVTKYGSKSTIWQNPKTSGGTFVADPTGVPHMVTTGDTVATQFAFDGPYDLSLVKDQATIPLWDTRPSQPTPEADLPITDADAAKIAKAVWTADGLIPNPNANPKNPFWTGADITADISTRLRAVQTALAALAGNDDPAALAKAVLLGLDAGVIAAAVAAAINKDQAQEFITELHVQLGK